jgi:hypothetical protein
VLLSSEHERRAAPGNDGQLIALCPYKRIASHSFVETPFRVVRSRGTGLARSYE